MGRASVPAKTLDGQGWPPHPDMAAEQKFSEQSLMNRRLSQIYEKVGRAGVPPAILLAEWTLMISIFQVTIEL